MQLEKILQSQGLGTRKACRSLIRSGQVSLSGRWITDPFSDWEPNQLQFSVGELVFVYRKTANLVMNKPAGFECSQRPRHHPSVYSLLPPYLQQRGVQAVGRLDEDTTGLLVLTDDGALNHALTSPRRKIEKIYSVTLCHPTQPALLEALSTGVLLHDSPDLVQAVACNPVGTHTLHLTLREGRYHQVKRMVAAAGNRVSALERIQVGHFHLPKSLLPGQWTWLETEDVEALLGSR